jgi:septal ring factor EnvC (AmiA/AmiB activator)
MTRQIRDRIQRRAYPAFAGAAVLLLALSSAEAARVPRPHARPHGEDAVSNAPQTGSRDLEKLEAEIAAQKRSREMLDSKRKLNQGASSDLQRRAIELAAAVQEKELAVTVARDNLDVLAARATKIRTRLKEQRGHLTETLAALELLERQRPPALAVKPEDATQAVRSAILLGDIVPRLKGQAETLAKQLSDLKIIRERIETEQKALEAAALALKSDEARLETLLAQKAEERDAIRAATSDQDRHLAEMARRAENLSALIEGIRADKSEKTQPAQVHAGAGQQIAGLWTSPGSAARSFAQARGRLRLPAVGKVIEKFGVPNDSGGTTKGVKIGTLPGARVVTPYDGRVKYAGPLKTYGQVLIVEAGDDYLIILAGLARVDAAVGQWLLAGEPVGRMADTGEVGPNELYLEFRKGREPFDPVPWLAGVTKEG